MRYWFYEHWTADDKAVVHAGSCGCCNEGRGCHGASQATLNGKWQGPYKSLADAKSAAKSTGRPVRIHKCVK